MGTDRDWEKWGATDPYFGVISREKYRATTISSAERGEFFATGRSHITETLAQLHARFGRTTPTHNCLDFGCGVGRLLIPLAQLSEHATGVDISASMLDEARKNCAESGITNITLAQSRDDNLSNLDGLFDLIHSDIVLPHIAWPRGRRIVRALAEHVAPGGCLALQMLTRCSAPWAIRTFVKLRYVVPPANWVRNLMRSRPIFEPAMQLHVYDLETIRKDLIGQGFDVQHDDRAIQGFTSTVVYARRSSSRHI